MHVIIVGGERRSGLVGRIRRRKIEEGLGLRKNRRAVLIGQHDLVLVSAERLRNRQPEGLSALEFDRPVLLHRFGGGAARFGLQPEPEIQPDRRLLMAVEGDASRLTLFQKAVASGRAHRQLERMRRTFGGKLVKPHHRIRDLFAEDDPERRNLPLRKHQPRRHCPVAAHLAQRDPLAVNPAFDIEIERNMGVGPENQRHSVDLARCVVLRHDPVFAGFGAADPAAQFVGTVAVGRLVRRILVEDGIGGELRTGQAVQIFRRLPSIRGGQDKRSAHTTQQNHLFHHRQNLPVHSRKCMRSYQQLYRTSGQRSSRFADFR